MKLLITDIDNTLLPQKEKDIGNKEDLEVFSKEVRSPDIRLGYASGRYLQMIRDAVDKRGLPCPDFLITNVGTRIYKKDSSGEWAKHQGYSKLLGEIWPEKSREKIKNILGSIKEITIQEPEFQSKFKLSYYTDLNYSKEYIVNKIKISLQEKDLKTRVVYSVDEQKEVGLLDVLPESSGKSGAIKFLLKDLNLSLDDALYCGDSGNDLDVFSLGVKGVLVGNAREEVKRELKELAEKEGLKKKVYISEKRYVAGVLEGMKNFGFI